MDFNRWIGFVGVRFWKLELEEDIEGKVENSSTAARMFVMSPVDSLKPQSAREASRVFVIGGILLVILILYWLALSDNSEPNMKFYGR